MLGFLQFLPTKKQWNAWNLPSKLTAIGILVALGSFFVGILVSVVLFVIGELHNSAGKEQLADEVRSIFHIHREREVPVAGSNSMEIVMGSNIFRLDPDAPSMEVAPFMTIRLGPEGVVRIDADFRDKSGDIVAELRDSVLTVPNIGYDVNSDRDAFEVVNADRSPVLQLTRGIENRFVLYFITTYRLNDEIFIGWCHPRGCGNRPVANDFVPPEWPKYSVPRIFEYPGHENLGQRRPAG